MEKPAKLKKTRHIRLPKSKTGCRTCRFVNSTNPTNPNSTANSNRTRHLKCDETPGACRRCTSAGFKCDGYDLERLSHKRNPNPCSTMALTEYQFRALLPDKTAEERRFFNYFHSFTIPMMNGWFDHRLWNSLVLQMCQSEPAICHAVVALSALQEVSEVAGITILPEDMGNRTHRFALYQYNRSIENLRARMYSNDPQVRSTVLLCCLLFIAFELMRGRLDEAITHLHNGLHILGTKKLDYHSLYQKHPAAEQDIERSLAAAMVHLDLQGAHFGFSETHEALDIPTLEKGYASAGPGPERFHSIQDGCFMRDRAFLHFCLWTAFCDSLSAAEIEAEQDVLIREQKKQLLQLANFGSALDQLEQKLYAEGPVADKDRRSLEVLRMHQKGLFLITEISLIKSDEVIRDLYADRFSEVVDMAAKITAGVQSTAREAGPRPTLLMDTTVIGPLYYFIEKCRNPVIAKRAIEILESWPHREGMWDSTLAAGMARSSVPL